MIEALGWWLSLEVLGLVALPVTFLLFRGLADRGYSLAKIVGLVFVGYVLWLGGIAGLLPHDRGSVILLLAAFAVVGLAVVGRNREEFGGYLRERWRYVLLVEGLFAASFFVAAWLRSFVPDIAATEKPMEVALLSSLARDTSLPAEDPWLSGHDINYYYFGYLLMASQVKLLGIGVNVGFNLAVATVVGLGSVAAFGIGYNLLAARSREAMAKAGDWVRPAALVVGLGAVVLLFIYSNYEGVFEMMAAHNVGGSGLYDFVSINGLDGPTEARVSTTWYPQEHWFWWRASRLHCEGCPMVITEFPFFSFLLGDLHPHVLAIPFLLLTAAIGWNLLSRSEEELWQWRMAPSLVAIFILVGSIGFIHTINLPVVLAMLAIMYGLREYRRHRGFGRDWLVSTGRFAVALTIGSLLVYLPFYATYETPASAIKTTNGPDTRPFHLFLQWGLFLLLVTGAAVYSISRSRRGWRFTPAQVAGALAPAVIAVVGWAVLRPFLAFGPEQTAGASGWLTLAWLCGTLTVLMLGVIRSLTAEGKERESDPMLYALALAALAVLVVMGSELFFIDDVFDSRLNTVFKGWYVAWLMLGLASAFSGYVLLREWRPRLTLGRSVYGVVAAGAAALVVAGLVYPVTATMNRTGGLDNPSTLDGLAFLENSRPGEREAIEWLAENVVGRPVVMEVTGDSFDPLGRSRVSAYTGLPTVLGWAGHEWQWRGSFDPQGTRRADVETAYSTSDIQEAQRILERYDVEFVYVGPLERDQYDAAALEKFGEFMDVAFENEEVTIYQRKGGRSSLVRLSDE